MTIILRIEFDHSDGIYRPGEEVSGRIILENGKMIEAKTLRVTLIGETKIGWTEVSKTHGEVLKNTIMEDVVHLSEEILIEISTPEKKFLSAGFHVFQFCFPALREDISRSFKGKFGKIWYNVEASVDSIRKTTKKGLEVLPIIDLNLIEKAQLWWSNKIRLSPVEGIVNKILVPRGASIGDCLPIHIKVSNYSKKSVTDISIWLIQTSSFSVTRHATKIYKRSVKSSKIHVNVESGNSENIKYNLQVPCDCPPSFKSRNIKLKYSLLVEISELSYKFPEIIIGTVPIKMDESEEESEEEEDDYTLLVIPEDPIIDIQPKILFP